MIGGRNSVPFLVSVGVIVTQLDKGKQKGHSLETTALDQSSPNCGLRAGWGTWLAFGPAFFEALFLLLTPNDKEPFFLLIPTVGHHSSHWHRWQCTVPVTNTNDGALLLLTTFFLNGAFLLVLSSLAPLKSKGALCFSKFGDPCSRLIRLLYLSCKKNKAMSPVQKPRQ